MALKILSLIFIGALQVTASGFWSSTPAQYGDNDELITQAYPIGNGRLGAMPFGSPGAETINLNIDSLWNGGPFEVDNYTGGNPASEVYSALPEIRSFIFENGTGNVDALLGNEDDYGSYQVLGNLSVSLKDVNSSSNYNRSLDFQTGLHTTNFASNGSTFTSTVYCSYPDQICVYNIQSTQDLPEVSIKLDNSLVAPNTKNATCGQGYSRLRGVTQLGPPEGMIYDTIAQLTSKTNNSYCNNATGYLTIPLTSGTKSLSFVIGAGTNYDQTKGTPEDDFSFKGADPASYVQGVTSAASAKDEASMRAAHVADYSALANLFNLSLPDTTSSAGTETSTLIANYNSVGTSNPYVEATLFDFGRHLFISSSRPNSLPPNLQGNWAIDLSNAWSGDYHIDINLQMNHWGVPETSLSSLTPALWNYMTDVWLPRGQQAAQLLYNSTGSDAYVLHSFTSTFAYTGMGDTAEWANYPIAPAWMMQHVFDEWDFNRNATWLVSTGYPLIRGAAAFWLSQLQEDTFTNDGTLVVNPCNSAEHGPTTFGCTHYQQLIHQLFTNLVAMSAYVPSSSVADPALVSAIRSALPRLDKGLHIGAWGEVKEWKLPDSFGYEVENDTHRHLSQLVGWYPGYSLSSYLNGTSISTPNSSDSNSSIRTAVATSLYSRGLGNGPDANAGWEKVWRGACWARLEEADLAYEELRYAIAQNFAPGNGLSMYDGGNGGAPQPPFQIDANFGLVGNVVAMLVTDLPQDLGDDSTHRVLLGPAIPSAWGGGSVDGLRLRGGGQVSFSWDAEGIVTAATVSERNSPLLVVNKNGTTLVTI